jgi:hypothetical protein
MADVEVVGPFAFLLDVFTSFFDTEAPRGSKRGWIIHSGEDVAYLDGVCLCKDSIIDLFHLIVCHMYILLQLVKLSSAITSHGGQF